MSSLKMSSEYERIVIGGGAAGALVALHYLSSCSAAGHEPRIAVVEPRASLAQGAAYSTDREEHRLNVPAGRMSAFADRPHIFNLGHGILPDVPIGHVEQVLERIGAQ